MRVRAVESATDPWLEAVQEVSDLLRQDLVINQNGSHKFCVRLRWPTGDVPVAGSLEGLGEVSAKQVVIGLAVSFLLLFVGIFGYFISIGVKQTQQRLEERSAAAAQVVATNAFWISEVANQTLRRVDAALGPEMFATAEDFALVLGGLPSITEIYVIDADAQTIYSTVPGAKDVSVADREYFTALRAGAAFYTSPMIVSRLTADRIFVFSKRVERKGTFAGAIMVSFSGVLLV